MGRLVFVLLVIFISICGCVTNIYDITNPNPQIPLSIITPTPTLTPLIISNSTTTAITQPTPTTNLTPTPLPSPHIDLIPKNLKTGEKDNTFYYYLYGEENQLQFQLYSGVISQIPNFTISDNETIEEEILHSLNNSYQDKYLAPLIQKIKDRTHSQDEAARLAISMVQEIKYSEPTYDDYIPPYFVLYYKEGRCLDKSMLLVYLLSKLGYETVLFYYPEESHAAVGIKVLPGYGNYDTQYMFIESTRPAIISYPDEMLHTVPLRIPISNGIAFESIMPDYNDALIFSRISNRMANHTESIEDLLEYNRIITKYRLDVP